MFLMREIEISLIKRGITIFNSDSMIVLVYTRPECYNQTRIIIFWPNN